MAEFRDGEITAKTGAAELGITERRFRQLQSSYLQACGEGKESDWQNRLPSYYLSESIRDIDVANEHLDQLRAHHNEHEIHRELKTPQTARGRRQAHRADAIRELAGEKEKIGRHGNFNARLRKL